MVVYVYIKGAYEEGWLFWLEKNKANMPSFGRKLEARNPKSEITVFEKTKPICRVGDMMLSQ